MRLENSLAVVSGASRGLGAALGLELARNKAHVILLARSNDELQSLKATIESQGGKATALVVDMRKPEAIAQVAKTILANHGVPDLIINNAGAGSFKFIQDTTAKDIVEMMELPFFAAFNLTREFLPAMMKRRSGMIVNISSPGAYIPWAGSAGYSTARWAMRGFSQVLRADTFGSGLRVCLVVPGEIQGTAYFDSNPGSKENMPMTNIIFPQQTASQLAKVICRGIRWNCKLIVAPWLMKMTLIFDRICPGLVEWIMHLGDRKRILANRSKLG